MGISKKDFIKIHMHGMEAEMGFFFIHVDGFLCAAGRRGEEEGKEREREKKGGKEGGEG